MTSYAADQPPRIVTAKHTAAECDGAQQEQRRQKEFKRIPVDDYRVVGQQRIEGRQRAGKYSEGCVARQAPCQ